jgi:hypothetical protein
LPEGLELALEGESLSVRYDGDVHLNTTLGRTLGHVEATGDVVVELDRITGTIIAGGRLVIRGNVAAERLSGRTVELGREKIRCRAISATEKILVGPASLKVDALIAPEIVLDPNAYGRVTVIESHNERGATKVKGGFSIADYEDMIGNADEFLASRGLSRLAAQDSSPPAAASREPVDDPVSLSVDDIEPFEDSSATQAIAGSGNSALDARLDDAVGRIVSCYVGSDLPPPVAELQSLIARRDYGALGGRITDVWNALLSHHQEKGIRPHHQVTHAFNVIHGLVST